MKILKNRYTNEVAIIVPDTVSIVVEEIESAPEEDEGNTKEWVDNGMCWKIGDNVVKYINDCQDWFDPEGSFLTNWDGELVLEVVENINDAPADENNWSLYNKYTYTDGVWALNINYIDPLLQFIKEDSPN